MTIVNHDTGEVIEPMSGADARRLTTEAQNELSSSRDHFNRAWSLIEQAVNGGGHLALGYRSPGDYLRAEFDGVLAGLDVEQRRLAVLTMTGWGLSTRAIGPVVGASRMAIHRDREAGVTTVTPANPAPVSAGVADAAPDVTPRPVTGIDGKTYTAPASRTERRTPLPDSYLRAVHAVHTKAEALTRLTRDDRFAANRAVVTGRYGPESAHLAYVIKAWNAWRDGKELAPTYRFRLSAGEKFPEPR